MRFHSAYQFVVNWKLAP